GRSLTPGPGPSAYATASVRADRLPRKHLIAHGKVIDKRGNDDGVVLEVVLGQALEGIHIRVVGADRVLDRILDELKARDADAVEAQVVGTAGVAGVDGDHAHAAEGREELLEYRDDLVVALREDPADRAGPVVDVDVCRDLGPETLVLGHP